MNDDKRWTEFTMGIRAPEGMSAIEEVSTTDGMRRAIYRAGARDSALIAQCMRHADLHGLSGEDRYVFLAYNALVQLENLHQSMAEHVARHPNPPIVWARKKGDRYT